MSIGKLTKVGPRPDHILDLGWDDGFQACLDLGQLIQHRQVLGPLRDPAEFLRATMSADGWSIEWPSGVDFGASQLRRWAVSGFGDRVAA